MSEFITPTKYKMLTWQQIRDQSELTGLEKHEIWEESYRLLLEDFNAAVDREKALLKIIRRCQKIVGQVDFEIKAAETFSKEGK